MPIIAIGGPTATGKTALGVQLAQIYGGEVISCDSMQVYRGMDIGTAKPTAEEMQGVVHHLLSVADPNEPFSVGRYVALAEPILQDLLARGVTPIIVGGTGLYMDALLKGEQFAPAPSEDLRRSLEADWDAHGAAAMLARLAEHDPETAARLNLSDRKRILRALEIEALTGKTASEHERLSKLRPPKYQAIRLTLTYADRAELYRRIDLRVDQMLENGLMDEIRRLIASGVRRDATAMQAIGYKEFLDVLDGKSTFEAATDAVKQGSRRYTKRQLTWFRRHADTCWLDRTEYTDFSEIVSLARRHITAFDSEKSVK
ncbi:MAG: tRNA (adenosine(37)-N6)-dimethylallyltransferase MiaA [Oscillospiraceae bacterium]|nr:tRNA (adenosine(37)-N6)-dimethylallyltransferase MiaA [Oscillospiraceae bacterium]